ncbi:HutD family protein [Xanthobacter tagetidis]|uniref:HutD family protein n=2 Tax=Xanthobacter tagetidis TaxID=60216 RepID=A0A3L7AB54_9HYPH|nr:HutD family protein [Xanthobacter tagetidis]RLP77215.1 HutD family protein [Xanthobacter tagetidis]
MRIIRSAEGRRMPWKNGGGETVEIACFPEGAGLNDFGWRVSSARVAVAGPFSLFPGVDRTLSVLTGDGLMLDFADGAEVRLDLASAPYAFPADVPVAGTPLGGPITDLNVMTRRGMFAHRVTRMSAPARLAAGAGAFALAFVAAGEAQVPAQDGRPGAALASGDAALVTGGAAMLLPGPEGCRLLLVEFAPA